MKIGCAELGKDSQKWALYVHMCPRSTHTFEELQSWVSKSTNTEYTPISWENQKFVFVQNPSTGLAANFTLLWWKYITATAANNFQLTFIQPMCFIFGWPTGFSVFIYPFVYKPTCATLGLTLAHNQMDRVNGVDSTSLRGAYPGVRSGTPTECVTQCANVPSLNKASSTMQTMH